ncbi:MAG: hypothetical protein K2Y37_07020 [Pirellulales bacterium]|nr:hypothetical protein [Pirellulales bacterium]
MPWPAVADVFSGFDKIFSRMTAAECVSICDAYGLLDSTPTVPDYLTAEGALTWMAYNDGAGAYYDPANPGWDRGQSHQALTARTSACTVLAASLMLCPLVARSSPRKMAGDERLQQGESLKKRAAIFCRNRRGTSVRPHVLPADGMLALVPARTL